MLTLMIGAKGVVLNLRTPSNLRMLCAILGVRVDEILEDFMWLVSYSAHDSADRKKRNAARKFFMVCGYGQPRYSEREINQMFDELKENRKLYETIDGMERDDRELFLRNRNMYVQYWFKRWFEKNNRKEDITVLDNY